VPALITCTVGDPITFAFPKPSGLDCVFVCALFWSALLVTSSFLRKGFEGVITVGCALTKICYFYLGVLCSNFMRLDSVMGLTNDTFPSILSYFGLGGYPIILLTSLSFYI
jgi:hypothetical protein